MKLINTVLLIATLGFFACQKEQEPTINPCANGQKDNDETEVDCGGSCTPCYHYPYLVVRFNGEPMQVNLQSSTKIIEKIGGSWFMKTSFSGAEVNINIGPDDQVGTYTIKSDSSVVYYNGSAYTLVDGIFGISENDQNLRQMSGNFQAHFTNGTQMLYIDDGQFEYLSY